MRGYLAFDCQSREKVFLKDAWRIRACGQEGVVYAKLRECQVEHISPVVAHGDVPGKWQSCGRDAKLYAPGSTFCEHIHYRILLKIVGKPLSSFSSTHELVTAICALESLICDLVDALARDTRDCSESWLKDHKWIIGRLRSALADEEWMKTRDDGSRVRELELSVEPVPRSAWRKRKASIEDYWVELEGDRTEREEREVGGL